MSIDRVLKYEEQTLFRLRALYSAYGYIPFKMSKFEEYELYARNKNFLVSDHIITFTDTDGKLLALKPDVTLSIVKNYRDGGLQKVYYDEHVYRLSGSTHAFREITQTGLECLGEIDGYQRAEVLRLAYESLSLITEDFVLDVSHLGIVSEVVELLGLSRAARGTVLTYLAEKNLHGLRALLAEEQVDEERAAWLCALVTLSGDPATVLPALAACLPDALSARIEELSAALSALPRGRVRVDFSVINDMSYYSGIVFRGFVKGVPTGVLSGGEYDNLMRRMGHRVGAIGFAVYLDELSRLYERGTEYDVDTALLYAEGDDPVRLSEAVRELTESGERVLACRTLPEKLTYRRVARLTEEGVMTVNGNA